MSLLVMLPDVHRCVNLAAPTLLVTSANSHTIQNSTAPANVRAAKAVEFRIHVMSIPFLRALVELLHDADLTFSSDGPSGGKVMRPGCLQRSANRK